MVMYSPSGCPRIDAVMYQPIHHTIVEMDVKESEERGDVLTLKMRSDLRTIVRDALTQASIDVEYDRLYKKDTGDGLRILFPAEIPSSLLIYPFIPNLNHGLGLHNRFTSKEDRLRLRVAIHQGPIHKDSKDGDTEWVGMPMVLCRRLLDAVPVRQVLEDDGTPDMVVVVSNSMYETVVAQGFTLDPGTFQEVSIQVKKTNTNAWIHVPSIPIVNPPAHPTQADMCAVHQEITPIRQHEIETWLTKHHLPVFPLATALVTAGIGIVTNIATDTGSGPAYLAVLGLALLSGGLSWLSSWAARTSELIPRSKAWRTNVVISALLVGLVGAGVVAWRAPCPGACYGFESNVQAGWDVRYENDVKLGIVAKPMETMNKSLWTWQSWALEFDFDLEPSPPKDKAQVKVEHASFEEELTGWIFVPLSTGDLVISGYVLEQHEPGWSFYQTPTTQLPAGEWTHVRFAAGDFRDTFGHTGWRSPPLMVGFEIRSTTGPVSKGSVYFDQISVR